MHYTERSVEAPPGNPDGTPRRKRCGCASLRRFSYNNKLEVPTRMKLAPVLAIAVILSVLPRPGLGQDRSSVEMFGGVSYLRATDHLRYPVGEINTFGLDFAATAYVTPRLGLRPSSALTMVGAS